MSDILKVLAFVLSTVAIGILALFGLINVAVAITDQDATYGTLDVECEGVPTIGNIQLCTGTVHQAPGLFMAVELITAHYAPPPPGGWPTGEVTAAGAVFSSSILSGTVPVEAPPVWSFRFGLTNVPCYKGRPYADIYLKCGPCYPQLQDEVHLMLHCHHLPIMPSGHVVPTPTPVPPPTPTPPKEAP